MVQASGLGVDLGQGLLLAEVAVVGGAPLEVVVGHLQDLGFQRHVVVVLAAQEAQETDALMQGLVGSQDVHGHLEDVVELLAFFRSQGEALAFLDDQVAGERDLSDLVKVAREEDLLGDHRTEHLAHLAGQLSDLLAVLHLFVAAGGLVELHQQVQVGVVQLQPAAGGELLLFAPLALLGLQQGDPLLEKLVHLHGQVGQSAVQDGEVVPHQDQGLDQIEGFDGGGPRLVDQQGHLAEPLTQAQLRQDQFATVDVFDDVNVPFADQVEGVPGLTFADDDLVGFEAAHPELLGDGLHHRAGKGIEEGIAGDEVGDLLVREPGRPGHARPLVNSVMPRASTP